MQQALEGIDKLRAKVDTLIIVPNEKLLQVVERRTSVQEAFRMADDILRQGVQGITDLITTPGQINLDFADVRTVMSDAGSAMMGIGVASGENRASEAAKMAISSPLMEQGIDGATGMLLNFTGSDDLNLFEVNEAADIVVSTADKSANIIFGTVIDPRHRRRGPRDGDRHRLRGLRDPGPQADPGPRPRPPPRRPRARPTASAATSRSRTTTSTSRTSSRAGRTSSAGSLRFASGAGGLRRERGGPAATVRAPRLRRSVPAS